MIQKHGVLTVSSNSGRARSWVLKASTVECQSVPSIGTLIDTWHSLNISVHSQLIFDASMWVGQHLVDYQPTTNQVSIKYRPSIDRDVERDAVSIHDQESLKYYILYLISPWDLMRDQSYVFIIKH